MATTNAKLDEQLQAWKDGERARWAAGDYDKIAKRDLWAIGQQLVERIGVNHGDRVLDVGCGTGNAAIRAAQAGADVVGLDLTPELLAAGRKEASKSGVTVEWVEGDAEAMPFDDRTFDVVLSVFGSIYPPRHEVVAKEMGRVLRAGGRIGFTAWAAGGMQRFMEIVEPFVPASPGFVGPLALWGTEEHVREVFEGTGIDFEFDNEKVNAEGLDPVGDPVEFYTTHFGPLIVLRRHAESEGRWEELRDALAPWYAESEAGYVIARGRRSTGPD